MEAPARWAGVESDLRCPITQELMVDPVVCGDGHTYERVAIAEWFATGKLRSPTTNEPLASQLMLANHAVRRLALSWRREQGQRVLAWCERAPRAGGAEELQAMVEGGAADLDVRDGQGRTPLLLLLLRGRDDLASLLLDRGALAGATDEDGRSVADLAAGSPLAARLRAAATLEGRQRMARAQMRTPGPAQAPAQQTQPEALGEAANAQGGASLHRDWATSSSPRHPAMGEPAADGAPRAATFFPSLFALQFLTLQRPVPPASAVAASAWVSDCADEDSPVYRFVSSLGFAVGGSLLLGVCFFT
jgi:ankyrin repeat protein